MEPIPLLASPVPVTSPALTESSVKADYYRNTNQEYSVHCQVTENALPLIDLTITVPSEAEAQAVTDNWQKKNQELYATIMAKLLG